MWDINIADWMIHFYIILYVMMEVKPKVLPQRVLYNEDIAAFRILLESSIEFNYSGWIYCILLIKFVDGI